MFFLLRLFGLPKLTGYGGVVENIVFSKKSATERRERMVRAAKEPKGEKSDAKGKTEAHLRSERARARPNRIHSRRAQMDDPSNRGFSSERDEKADWWLILERGTKGVRVEGRVDEKKFCKREDADISATLRKENRSRSWVAWAS